MNNGVYRDPVRTYARRACLLGGFAVSICSCGGGGNSSAIAGNTPPALPPQLSVFAGAMYTSGGNSVDGTGVAALFDGPAGLSADRDGNIYLVDNGGTLLRKITQSGVVTTLAGNMFVAGSADGIGSNARFHNATGTAVDASGNIYVADMSNCTIRKVTPSGVVSTLAGTAQVCGSTDASGAAARFLYPQGVAVDGMGNVYVADTGNNAIRKVTPAGVVTTFAGTAGTYGSADGTGTAARFNIPVGIAADSAGNVYVGDVGNMNIRKVTPSGLVTTIAGTAYVQGSTNGTGTSATFNYPNAIVVDSAGDLFIAEAQNSDIRKVTASAFVSTVVGTPGQTGFVAGNLRGQLSFPSGVARFGSTLYTTTNNAIVQARNVP